jgi:hypothetical protein
MTLVDGFGIVSGVNEIGEQRWRAANLGVLRVLTALH